MIARVPGSTTGVPRIPSPPPAGLMFVCQTMAPLVSSRAYTTLPFVAAKNSPLPAARVVALHVVAAVPVVGHPMPAGPFSRYRSDACILPLNVALKFVSRVNVPAACVVRSGSTKFSRRSKSFPLWRTDKSAGTPVAVQDGRTVGTHAVPPLEALPEVAPLVEPVVAPLADPLPVPALVPLLAPVPPAPEPALAPELAIVPELALTPEVALTPEPALAPAVPPLVWAAPLLVPDPGLPLLSPAPTVAPVAPTALPLPATPVPPPLFDPDIMLIAPGLLVPQPIKSTPATANAIERTPRAFCLRIEWPGVGVMFCRATTNARAPRRWDRHCPARRA